MKGNRKNERKHLAGVICHSHRSYCGLSQCITRAADCDVSGNGN